MLDKFSATAVVLSLALLAQRGTVGMDQPGGRTELECDAGGVGAESCAVTFGGSDCQVTCCEGFACCTYVPLSCECKDPA
jgi:hypothetical protein